MTVPRKFLSMIVIISMNVSVYFAFLKQFRGEGDVFRFARFAPIKLRICGPGIKWNGKSRCSPNRVTLGRLGRYIKGSTFRWILSFFLLSSVSISKVITCNNLRWLICFRRGDDTRKKGDFSICFMQNKDRSSKINWLIAVRLINPDW